jgi:ribonucleotide reductase beta subunit family protein with ferritin-like domain
MFCRYGWSISYVLTVYFTYDLTIWRKTKMKKKVHKPPSRIKYDESHPTVSARVDRKLYDELKELQKLTKKSLTDILREAVRKQKPWAKDAYDIGKKVGYDSAKMEFGVTYRCSVCGGMMTVNTEREKKEIAQYMREHGWKHGNCVR